MLSYQNQNCRKTLAEGIGEYRTAFEPYLSSRELSVEGIEFFRCHDVAHVVFGCGIDLSDEAIVKISSLFGTTEGFGVMRGYALPESKEIYDEIGFSEILSTAVKSFVTVPRTFWRCTQMNKRWPWDSFDEYLDQPLTEIRQAFGIRVAHTGSDDGFS